jgi:hypothetical protein
VTERLWSDNKQLALGPRLMMWFSEIDQDVDGDDDDDDDENDFDGENIDGNEKGLAMEYDRPITAPRMD